MKRENNINNNKKRVKDDNRHAQTAQTYHTLLFGSHEMMRLLYEDKTEECRKKRYK